jgi:hypothetical protein
VGLNACLAIGLVLISSPAWAKSPPCCPDHPELSYLFSPGDSGRFRYIVRHETFYSRALGKEKDFFLILPKSEGRFPLVVLLHGYNFHRNGWKSRVCDPVTHNVLTCKWGEEQHHWLLLEDVALIHQAMMDPSNTTHGALEADLRERFEELRAHGGLLDDDYDPAEIARSIVRDNLNPNGSSADSFTPIYPMALLLPDGDNSFYADENEGRSLFPPTASRKNCDHFNPGECFKHSLIPYRYMKPGALGQYETYILALVHFLRASSTYGGMLMEGIPVGIGGISMGGLGAMKLGLRHRPLFGPISCQSGLLDIEIVTDKLMLKLAMPEFIEVFGRLKADAPYFQSTLDASYVRKNNPIRGVQALGLSSLPPWMYFDYGANEGYEIITRGNWNLERLLHTGSRSIHPQAFNGRAGHNYQFWRSRAANVLFHHSRFFRRLLNHRGENPLQ